MGDVGSLALGARARHGRDPDQAGTAARHRRRRVRASRRCRWSFRSASFKLTGKRVFRMAPLHHHFELIGWSEPKVIARFVIVGDHLRAVQPDDAEAAVGHGDGDGRVLGRGQARHGGRARRAAGSRRPSCWRGAARASRCRTARTRLADADARTAAASRASRSSSAGTSRRPFSERGPDRARARASRRSCRCWSAPASAACR